MFGQKEIYDVLNRLNIEYRYFEHEAVFTASASAELKKHVPGVFCKNIFFRNHKGNKHYLVVLRHDKQVDIKLLVKLLNQGRLSFASEKRLLKYLNVKPGSVSPLGLVNDSEAEVQLFIDKDLEKAEQVSFHPNINSVSLMIKTADLIKFVEYCGNSFEFIDLTV